MWQSVADKHTHNERLRHKDLLKSAVSSANSNGLVVNGVKVSQSQVCYCGPWVSVMLKAVMCLCQVTRLCVFPRNPHCVVYPLTLIGIQPRTDTHFHLHTLILSPQRFINSKLRALGCYFNKRVSPNPLAINSIFIEYEGKNKNTMCTNAYGGYSLVCTMFCHWFLWEWLPPTLSARFSLLQFALWSFVCKAWYYITLLADFNQFRGNEFTSKR